MTRRTGFTLIEIVGAIVIFAAGVLAAAQLSLGLAQQMQGSALRSAVVMDGQAFVDSLSVLDYATFDVGASTDTLTILSRRFERSVTVSKVQARVLEVQVLTEPLNPPGPVFSSTAYVFERW